jgi:hypothetical protein
MRDSKNYIFTYILVTLAFEWEVVHVTQFRLAENAYRTLHMRGPFAKFVNLPYCSESELYGGAVTVSFSKYLHWQAIHFLQRSTHFSKTCCRPLITSKFPVSELYFHGWKSPEIACGEIWIEFCIWLGERGSVEPHQNIRHTVQISPGPCDFWAFPTMKREFRGKKFRSDQRSAARFREVIGAL